MQSRVFALRRRSVAVLLVVGVFVGCGGHANSRATPTPTPRPHLTAAEICSFPQPVPCDLIDRLPTDKRAALESDVLRFLHGRTVEQAVREREASRAQVAAEARAAGAPADDGKGETLAPGHIAHLPVHFADFKLANNWLATDRL